MYQQPIQIKGQYLYKKKNLCYSGSGHTTERGDSEAATSFCEAVMLVKEEASAWRGHPPSHIPAKVSKSNLINTTLLALPIGLKLNTLNRWNCGNIQRIFNYIKTKKAFRLWEASNKVPIRTKLNYC